MQISWQCICILLLIQLPSLGQDDTIHAPRIRGWSEPFYVTHGDPVMDSVGGIKYRLRIDTLFKYLEKPPSSSWKLIWVYDKQRVDLKRGDLLRILSEDESRCKDYFRDVDTVPETVSIANLGAITWPDIPDYTRANPVWKGDTIPYFDPHTFLYYVEVPWDQKTVPALAAIPEDLNARIVMDRAD